MSKRLHTSVLPRVPQLLRIVDADVVPKSQFMRGVPETKNADF
jgi:hypothetical protein